MVSYSVVPLLECYQVYSQQYRPTLGVVRNISIGMLNKVWTPARSMSHSEGVGGGSYSGLVIAAAAIKIVST